MVKAFITVSLVSVLALAGYIGNKGWNKKATEEHLSFACATSLTTLNAKLSKQKHINYGEFHEYVFKRVSWMYSQVKASKMNQAEFQNQALNLLSTYAPTSMKTCKAILEPNYKKCVETKDAQSCTVEAYRAFAFGLKLVFDDAVSLKQELDLTKIVAFDIRTAVQQSRPRMPASEKTDLKNYAGFLQ